MCRPRNKFTWRSSCSVTTTFRLFPIPWIWFFLSSLLWNSSGPTPLSIKFRRPSQIWRILMSFPSWRKSPPFSWHSKAWWITLMRGVQKRTKKRLFIWRKSCWKSMRKSSSWSTKQWSQWLPWARYSTTGTLSLTYRWSSKKSRETTRATEYICWACTVWARCNAWACSSRCSGRTSCSQSPKAVHPATNTNNTN